jgi:hypothetical protein
MVNYRTMPHHVLAQALVHSALAQEPGAKRYFYRDILRIAGT